MSPNTETKEPLIIDGKTGLPDTPAPDGVPSAAQLPLNAPIDIRREMAKVYREMRAKKLDSTEGYRLVMVLGEIRKSIETTEIESRLCELEGKRPAPQLSERAH